MKAIIASILCTLLLPTLVHAEGVLTSAANPPDAVLYDYRTTLQLQDDFIAGTNSSANVGTLGWLVGGTVTVQVSEANRLGLRRLDTSASSGTQARIHLNDNVSIDPALTTTLRWIVRLNTNDANTTVRIGAMNSIAASPPTNGIYIEKLDADTNWFCITRSGAVQSRTDSTIPVSTNFATFTYTRTSAGVQFAINGSNVCSVMPSNIPTTFLAPVLFIINSAAASKTIDADYFQLQITGLTR